MHHGLPSWDVCGSVVYYAAGAVVPPRLRVSPAGRASERRRERDSHGRRVPRNWGPRRERRRPVAAPDV